MPGPLPKDPILRQRRNRTSTRAVLPAERRERKRAPQLPRNQAWHKLTRAWWRDVWRSPMASEYLEVDLHGLYMLAALLDRFWQAPSTALAAEIRQQRQCFGLTPIDRRRLQWELKRAEAVSRKQPRSMDQDESDVEDPRRAFRLVK